MKNSKFAIYLDDDKVNRNPPSEEWIRLYSYDEFVSWIEKNGLPVTISFDHDLGEGKTGKDCANWLVNYCIDHDLDLPKYYVHSANPVGRDNIISLLENYEKFRDDNKF